MKPRIWSLAAAVVPAAAMQAQTSRGTVSGTILDPTGAVVVGATVVLTHTEAGVRRTAVSNEAGIYRFDAADLGRYEIQVTRQGFRPFLATSFGVEANRTTTIDARLEVGGVDQQVTVSAESSEMLVKDGPLRGGNFQPREVHELPLIGLNPLSLARTLPGVTQTSGSSAWGNNWGEYNFAVNGQRQRSNNFLLDGTDNNDIGWSRPAQPFNIADAVEEVSAQTANYGVEFGRAGGGVFNVVTKSGTNSIHGTLLWRYQSQRFNSVSNAAKLNGIPQSVYSRNVAGFTFGGPIRKDKTFFFGGFQQDNNHSTQNFSLGVPTQEAVARRELGASAQLGEVVYSSRELTYENLRSRFASRGACCLCRTGPRVRSERPASRKCVPCRPCRRTRRAALRWARIPAFTAVDSSCNSRSGSVSESLITRLVFMPWASRRAGVKENVCVTEIT